MKLMLLYLQIPTYRTPDYKKVSSKLDTSDPTPQVHHPRRNIDELVCDEVIHYHSRYKHSSRPYSAPAKHEHLHSGSSTANNSKHFLLERDHNLHSMESNAAESSSENTKNNHNS